MKICIVLCVILGAAYAKPAGLFFPALAPVHTSVIAAAAPIQSQFHAQDVLGQYSYGYNSALSSRGEIKSFDGITRGSYSYIDADGKLQTVDYTADDLHGFRVAATNIPQSLPAPEQSIPEQIADTPEVEEARAAHLAALEDARRRENEAQSRDEEEREREQQQEQEQQPEPQQAEDTLPQPVEDTPEVAKAKAEHLEAHKQAELRNAIAAAHEIHITAPAILKHHDISGVPILSTLRTASIPATAVLHHASVPVYHTLNNHAVETRILPGSSLII